jgi:hypothetical protein
MTETAGLPEVHAVRNTKGSRIPTRALCARDSVCSAFKRYAPRLWR